MGGDHDSLERPGTVGIPQELRHGPLGVLVALFDARGMRPRAALQNPLGDPLEREPEGSTVWDVRERAALDALRSWRGAMAASHGFETLLLQDRFAVDDTGTRSKRGRVHVEGSSALRVFLLEESDVEHGSSTRLAVVSSDEAYATECDDLRAYQAAYERSPAALEEREFYERSAEESWKRARSEMVDRIKRAAQAVRDDLATVGRHAAYVWPSGPATAWEGFSYEIPKEEQIRSCFWARMHEGSSLACELEWNVYVRGERGVKLLGEVDLVGFRVSEHRAPPVLLLEFKRVWTLLHWVKKPAELTRGIERDIEKLRAAVATLSECAAAPLLAGVVVAGFAHDAGALGMEIEALHPALADHSIRRVELWRDTAPICHAPVDTRTATVTRDVYMRLDLLILED